MVTMFQGDCLEEMQTIPEQSVDMVLCDLPYEMLDCEWDKQIPFEPLWAAYDRVTKENAALVFTACQPFTTQLINSRPKLFRYSLVWKKSKKVGFLNAKKMPLRAHEDILVFYKRLPTYNPQGVRPFTGKLRVTGKGSAAYKYKQNPNYVQKLTGYPGSVLEISSENGTKHPTQKPVALMEYLVRTYTNPGDLVLDNCMGSGTTGVACVQSGREFVGIERDSEYFKIAENRIAKAERELKSL